MTNQDTSALLTSVLVVGMRKSGTTWLYENLKEDSDFDVNLKAKESRFFTGDSSLNNESYDSSFANNGLTRIEVDASVCSSKNNQTRINEYNPNMRVVLILREPAEYLVSRYVHSKRKGEIKEDDIESALENNSWLVSEINFLHLVGQYDSFLARGDFLLLFFDHLTSDPTDFYKTIKTFALNGADENDFMPSLERVNISRKTSLSFVSKVLSGAAMYFRKKNMHGLVNYFKAFALHEKMEQPVTDAQRKDLLEITRETLLVKYPNVVEDYNQLRRLHV